MKRLSGPGTDSEVEIREQKFVRHALGISTCGREGKGAGLGRGRSAAVKIQSQQKLQPGPYTSLTSHWMLVIPGSAKILGSF